MRRNSRVGVLHREQCFEESKEKIFARSWQFLGMIDEINNLTPFTVLENFLDEPVLFTKQQKSELSFKRLHASRENFNRKKLRSKRNLSSLSRETFRSERKVSLDAGV